MVSWTVRMDKVKTYTALKSSSDYGSLGHAAWIISVLGHEILKDFKLEGVQRKMLRQGNKMEKMH